MKSQNVSTVTYHNKSFAPAFKKAQFIKSPDLEELINYAVTDKTAMSELMSAMEILAQKNKNTMLKYSSSNNGEIHIENLNTGSSVIKINEYNRATQKENLKSLCRFAMPCDEQHQRLLGDGMSKHQCDELKDIASLTVYEDIQRHPANKAIRSINSQIAELETQKAEKLKEIVYSKVFCG